MKKKLILGLLALSVIVLAEPITIGVETTLNINDSGIIITDLANGITSINSIQLDHGTPDKSGNSMTEEKKVYIKTSEGLLPSGMSLNIALNSSGADKNNLVTGTKTNVEIIPHELTGVIRNAEILDSNTLRLVENTIESAQNIKTTDGALEVGFTSTVIKNNLIGKIKGDYTNTSTMSVTLLAN